MIEEIDGRSISDPLHWFAAEYPALIACVESAYDLGQLAAAWELSCYLALFFESRSQWDAWEKTHLIGLKAALEL